MLDPVDVAAPPALADVIGQRVPAVAEDVVECRRRGVDVARERAVEVEQYGAWGPRHRTILRSDVTAPEAPLKVERPVSDNWLWTTRCSSAPGRWRPPLRPA